MPTLLIIDDEPDISAAIGEGFRRLDMEVLTAPTAAEGLSTFTAHRPDTVLVDIGLPDVSGFELLRKMQDVDGRIPIILMTGQGTTEKAIEAMRLGAYDYVLKPFSFSRIRDLVLRAVEISRTMRVPVVMSNEAADVPAESDVMLGNSEAMQSIYKMIGRIAQQEAIVLIRGESGTGKELVARAIYQYSRRAGGPFLAINCAAIPETLLESELFGHERGAFTGADRRRVGKFEQCSGGTLFLDEIGDMPLLTQAKILRVLQEQRFERIGGTETIRTDVRLIAATNRDLESMVAAGQFRNDLYYRLNVFTISLPPLRDRIDDLPLLVRYFLGRFSGEMGREARDATPAALEILKRYSWPGNLRELQSVLRQALLNNPGPLLLPDFLPDSIRSTPQRPREPEPDGLDWEAWLNGRLHSGSTNLHAEWTQKSERHLLTRVLRHVEGNQLRAAAILGITRRSLRNKIRTLGITIERSVWSDEDPNDEDRSEATDPESP